MTAIPLRLARAALAALILAAAPSAAQEAERGPLRIEITEGVIEPIPVALPRFEIRGGGAAAEALAEEVRAVVAADLVAAGLVRVIDEAAYLARPPAVDTRPELLPWRAIEAEALGVGDAALNGDGRLEVRFQLWDVYGERPQGDGIAVRAAPGEARRIAHRIADAVHLALTGEPGWFTSRVAFVSESGPKDARVKRISVMDWDGANYTPLTDGRHLALTPRFSPQGDRLIYTSWETGEPRVILRDMASGATEVLGRFPGMTFAPRFSPDGASVVFSLSEGGETDLWRLRLADRSLARLTNAPGIETAPSFSPDGAQIVFESDAGGSQQLYVMAAAGGPARRISFGEGRYGTPVWSPRGDLIAFTKILRGRFHIGVMRPDGSRERLLTASFLDEGPTWAPNGRALMFFRETPGPTGAPAIWRVDADGRNLRRVPTPGAASDPSWSALLP